MTSSLLTQATRASKWPIAIGFLLFMLMQDIGMALASDSALKFDIPLVKGGERFIELIQYPSYLAVALENSGIPPSNSGRITILNRQTLGFRNAFVQFKKRNGNVFHYVAKVQWDMAGPQVSYELPIDVDVGTGDHLSIRIFTAGAGLLPESFTQKIQLKMQAIAGIAAQQAVLNYLSKIESRSGVNGIDSVLENILVDSYNLPISVVSNGACEPGDAQPLREQMALILTLLIWLVLVPIGFSIRYFKRFRASRSSAK